MKFEKRLYVRIFLGYVTILAIGVSMATILVHERGRLYDIENEVSEIRNVKRNINIIHQHITELSIQGEGVIGWEEEDYHAYRGKRLYIDSLLQAIKPNLVEYIYVEHIDTLRQLLADKENHLRHIMQAIKRQDEVDSLIVNYLPEVARRATRVRTVKQKKSGLAGFFGGKKDVQVMPSANELHAFSDSLIAQQSRYNAEMEAYANSLYLQNKRLNIRLNSLINNMNERSQAILTEREHNIAYARTLSVRLFTATLSAAIILLFFFYLTIHRELKRNAGEKIKREEVIEELKISNERNRELIRLRRNLIQNVAHELRTPLSAIKGNAELLLKDKEDREKIRHTEVIESSAKRMSAMIDNLLEYFRLDNGKVSLVRKPFRLNRISETLEAEFALFAANKGLVEKPRDFDPFGQIGLSPLATI